MWYMATPFYDHRLRSVLFRWWINVFVYLRTKEMRSVLMMIQGDSPWAGVYVCVCGTERWERWNSLIHLSGHTQTADPTSSQRWTRHSDRLLFAAGNIYSHLLLWQAWVNNTKLVVTNATYIQSFCTKNYACISFRSKRTFNGMQGNYMKFQDYWGLFKTFFFFLLKLQIYKIQLTTNLQIFT